MPALVADRLGVSTRVLSHPFAGVLSAYGMGLADLRIDARARHLKLHLSADDLAALAEAVDATMAAEMESDSREEILQAQDIAPEPDHGSEARATGAHAIRGHGFLH